MAASNENAGGRWFLRGGLVVLAGTAGASFGRLFQGGGTGWRLAVAGAAAAALASVLERRNLLLSLAVGAAGLVVALGVLVFPGDTILGLPTPATFRALSRALGDVTRDAATQFTPADPLPSLVSASAIAMWCAAYAAHALAVRAGSAILAALPPAGLVAFAGMLTPGGPRRLQVALLVVSTLALLFGAGLGRLRTWGPVLSSPGRRTPASALTRDARRLTFAALVAALLVPGVLPGLGAEGLLRLNEGFGTRVTIDPIVDIRPSLRRNPPIELFTVRARRPSYWRLLTLDRFNGTQWTAPGIAATPDERAPIPPNPLPTRFGVAALELVQDFQISGLQSIYLPVAHYPLGVDVPLAGAGFSEEHDTVIVPETPSGLTYRASSDVSLPTVPDADALTYKDFEEAARAHPAYSGLPQDVPFRVAQLTREIVAGEDSPFREIVAIQDHLRGFTYDLSVPGGHQGNAILHFLERSRRGYCEQFAAAMAIMVRSLGYPARVAVGFTQGTLGTDRRYHVTSREAHAWPEVFIPGGGWVAFEPTPTRSNPVTGQLVDAPATLEGGVASAVRARTQSRESAQAQRQAAERAGPVGARNRGGADDGLLPRIPLAAAGVLTLLAGWAGLRRIRRRLAIARAPSPRASVLAAYRAFEASASDVGLPRAEAETPQEYAKRLRSDVTFSDGHLERLTGLLERAAFSADGVQRTEAAAAGEATRRLGRDVRRHAGWLRSIAGALRPGW